MIGWILSRGDETVLRLVKVGRHVLCAAVSAFSVNTYASLTNEHGFKKLCVDLLYEHVRKTVQLYDNNNICKYMIITIYVNI